MRINNNIKIPDLIVNPPKSGASVECKVAEDALNIIRTTKTDSEKVIKASTEITDKTTSKTKGFFQANTKTLLPQSHAHHKSLHSRAGITTG